MYIVSNDISLKLDVLGYISVAECLHLSSITLAQCTQKLPSSMEKRKIWAISPFKVIQGHQLWDRSKAHMAYVTSN